MMRAALRPLAVAVATRHSVSNALVRSAAIRGVLLAPQCATRPSTRLMSSIPSLDGMPAPFPYTEGRYNSAEVNAAKVRAEDTADFATKLYATITHLRHEKKDAMWLKVPTDFAHYIPIAGHYGFKFHHCEREYVMMAVWLRGDVPNKIPAFATHHVGVAGCVMNAANEVLVVKERHPKAIWKFPGGLAERGEDLGVAAAREVREETGIDCDFESVLTFRQQHGMQFGNSDLYFICRMRVSEEAAAARLQPCTHEISEAKWVPLSEFAAANSHPMMAVVTKMLTAGPQKSELKREVQDSVIPGRPPYSLYFHDAA
jgi:8-oxo-dGTP pyrophosphatase MutT (NUDIX family)